MEYWYLCFTGVLFFQYSAVLSTLPKLWVQVPVLENWSKKPSTHKYFLSTTEYFFILKLFYRREIYIKVSKYLERLKTLTSLLSILFAHNVSFSGLLVHIIALQQLRLALVYLM